MTASYSFRRKKDREPPNPKNENYDWVGTVHFVNLFPQCFLLYGLPVIYSVSHISFKNTIYTFASFFLGVLFTKMHLIFDFNLERSAIRNNLLISQFGLCLGLFIFAITFYFYRDILLFTTLPWTVIGVSGSLHNHYYQNLLEEYSSYSLEPIKKVSDSHGMMIQSFFYFLLIFFLTILLPFIFSLFFSFFPSLDIRFSLFMPIVFNTLLLTFLSIYHFVILNTDYEESLAKERIIIRRRQKIDRSSFNYLKKIPLKSKVFFQKFWHIISVILLGENLTSNVINTILFPIVFIIRFSLLENSVFWGSYEPLMLDLGILSSFTLLAKITIYFYLPNYYNSIQPKILIIFSAFVVIYSISACLLLSFLNIKDFYLFALIFIFLSLSGDILQITIPYFHKKKGIDFVANPQNFVTTSPLYSSYSIAVLLFLSSIYYLTNILTLYLLSLLGLLIINFHWIKYSLKKSNDF